MQPDFELQAHVDYRIDSAREMRHQIALAEFVYDEPNDGEEQPRWSFVPRFVRRDA